MIEHRGHGTNAEHSVVDWYCHDISPQWTQQIYQPVTDRMISAFYRRSCFCEEMIFILEAGYQKADACPNIYQNPSFHRLAASISSHVFCTNLVAETISRTTSAGKRPEHESEDKASVSTYLSAWIHVATDH